MELIAIWTSEGCILFSGQASNIPFLSLLQVNTLSKDLFENSGTYVPTLVSRVMSLAQLKHICNAMSTKLM